MKNYARIFIIFLFISFTFAQTQLGSDIDGEAQGDYSGTSVSMNSAGAVSYTHLTLPTTPYV